MAKLSQQLKSGRLTRTQRVAQQQQQVKEEKEFQTLKTKADAVRQEQFGEVQSIEDYSQKYSGLSSDIKPFFSTPEEVKSSEDQNIAQTKSKVQDRISYARQQIDLAKTKYEEDVKNAEANYIKKRTSTSNADKKARYKRQLKEKQEQLEDTYEEKVAKYQGMITGLNEGLSQLNQGKSLTYQSISSYANDIAQYERSKEQAINDKRELDREERQKVAELESRGYTPLQIEKTIDGNPQTTTVSYINWSTGDNVKLSEYDTRGSVNVSGLKQATSVPTSQTFKVGGKDLSFKSAVAVYEDTSSNVYVTPYSTIEGITPQDVKAKELEEARAKAVEEKRIELINKGVKFDQFEGLIVTQDQLPLGYGGQQTISTQPTTLVLTEEQAFNVDYKSKPSIISPIIKGYDWARDRVSYTGEFSLNPFDDRVAFGLIEYGKKPDTKPEQIAKITLENLQEKSLDIETKAIGREKVKTFEEDLKTKYQDKYQTEFEKQYYEDLVYERIQPEKAQEEFEASAEARRIGKEYEEEYGKGYKKLQQEIPFLDKVPTGFKQLGIKGQELSVKFVSNPLDTATATAGIIGGVKVLGAIPSAVSTGLNLALFPYGTYKFVSPTSTPLESATGLITAGFSGYGLGKSAVRYYNKPVVKTVNIKPPRMNLKATESIAYTKKGLTIYPKQQVGQVVSEGRRTLVTTQGRLLKAGAWKTLGVKTSAKDLYITRGLPSDMIRPTKYLTGFRGTYAIKDMSNYQKAYKLLTNYGYTPYQASNVLRYTAPRVYSQSVEGIVLDAKGKALVTFETTAKPEVITVSDKLGIKTRGGKEIVQRSGSYRIAKPSDIEGVDDVLELGNTQKVYTSSKKLVEVAVDDKVFLSRTFVKSLKKGEYFVPTQNTDYFKAYQKATGQKLIGAERYKLTGDIFPSTKGIQDLDLTFGGTATRKALILEKADDVVNTWLKPADVKKTPFTFAEVKPSQSNIKAIKEILDKSDDIPLSVKKDFTDMIKTTKKIDSIYAGSGRYELSFGGASPNINPQTQTLLKAPIVAPVKINAIKNIILLKDVVQTGQAFGLATVQSPKVDLKSLVKLRVDTDFKLDVGIKTDEAVKLDVASKLDSGTKLSTGQRFATPTQTPTFLETPLVSPTTPKTPQPRVPTVTPPFLINFLKRQRQKASTGRKIQKQDFAYLPDFTSRSLGLDPLKLDVKQAVKKVKEIQTGFEIRRGVVVIK